MAGFQGHCRPRSLISFVPTDTLPLWRVFVTGLLSNVLNPKPGLFVVAFIPQFVSTARGSVVQQMLVYGALFAVITAVIFTLLGLFSARLSRWLSRRPKVVAGANIGAGITFIAAGLSILALAQRQ
jgi:threonine/homoserine/homoserine lactone efflux protein